MQLRSYCAENDAGGARSWTSARWVSAGGAEINSVKNGCGSDGEGSATGGIGRMLRIVNSGPLCRQQLRSAPRKLRSGVAGGQQLCSRCAGGQQAWPGLTTLASAAGTNSAAHIPASTKAATNRRMEKVR